MGDLSTLVLLENGDLHGWGLLFSTSGNALGGRNFVTSDHKNGAMYDDFFLPLALDFAGAGSSTPGSYVVATGMRKTGLEAVQVVLYSCTLKCLRMT